MPLFKFGECRHIQKPTMSSFSYITKHILTLDHINTNGKTMQIPNQQKIIFQMSLNTNYTIQSKYQFFIDSMNNGFYNSEIKNDFTLIFDKIQKTYNSFRKFAYIYKFNKSNIVVADDLCLNPIKINDRNIICLYQEKRRYLFNILDLINIINTSLSNSFLFFACPLPIKNPYTNIPFNKSTLYNIYFFMKFSTYYTDELYSTFYKSNLNLTCLLNKHEYLLRDHTIENYVSKSDTDTLHVDILEMIFKLNRTYLKKDNRLKIHEDFPKQALVRVMKPYLRLWMHCGYSLIPCKASNCANLLIKKYRRFVKNSPCFGRKIIKCNRIWTLRTNRILYKHSYSYNETHVSFKEKNNVFMKNHIN